MKRAKKISTNQLMKLPGLSGWLEDKNTKSVKGTVVAQKHINKMDVSAYNIEESYFSKNYQESNPIVFTCKQKNIDYIRTQSQTIKLALE